MDYYQFARAPSCQDSLKAIEGDIQHANMLAASISKAEGGAFLQMKLGYTQLAPLFLYFLQWFDCSCMCLPSSFLNLFHVVVYKVHLDGKKKFSSHGRKATIEQFYDVILPSLQHLYEDSLERDFIQDECCNKVSIVGKKSENRSKHLDSDSDREDECGICLEMCTKMVLPHCCHAMCINCYRDWSIRSELCPFCRGSLKRVESGDLWVLCSGDVVDQETLSKEDMLRFCLYINSLPKDIPDALFFVYYEYLI